MDAFQDGSNGRPALLPGTRVFDVEAADGDVRRLFVHVPPGNAPVGGWPLLAMTDGNAVIATAIDALRVQASYPMGTDVEPGVIVAIGYRVEGAYDPLRRSFDLSPPPGRSYPPFSEGTPPVVTGGADRFRRFIEEDVFRLVESLAPIDPARRTLFGHSFGGLFALHVLFAGSRAFSRYVAASPSISWEDGVVLDAEQRFLEQNAINEAHSGGCISPNSIGFRLRPYPQYDLAEPLGLDQNSLRHREPHLSHSALASEAGRPVVLHLSAGEYEGEDLAPFQYGRADTAKRLDQAKATQTLGLAKAMATRLGALPGIDVAYETYPGETHMTVLPVAVSRAVRVAFRSSI